MEHNDLSPQELVDFVEKTKDQLKPILDLPGAVLFNSYKTLKQGRYYFLGINPGGVDGLKIRCHLELLARRGYTADPPYESAYDEKWTNGPGQHLLQKNFKFLFKELGVCYRDVCATNLVFAGSEHQDDCKCPDEQGNILDWEECAEKICWPVHETILDEIVRPKVIVTFGFDVFDFIFRVRKGKEYYPHIDPNKQGVRRWCEAKLTVGTATKLIGIRHPHPGKGGPFDLAKNDGIIGEIDKFLNDESSLPVRT
ncbi:MAG: hypothetical protein FWD64_02455 [Acidobacteriaceae bacterium]|nr:hypothetical protein [Acidobacteriaceae bacterium]